VQYLTLLLLIQLFMSSQLQMLQKVLLLKLQQQVTQQNQLGFSTPPAAALLNLQQQKKRPSPQLQLTCSQAGRMQHSLSQYQLRPTNLKVLVT
jgi:hypothetical protein